MRKTKIKSALLCSAMAMSFFLSACGNDNKNSTTEEVTDMPATNTVEQTTEVSAEITTNTTELSSEVTTENITTEDATSVNKDWETAKTSGTEEAFNTYFNLDVKPYKTKNEQAGETKEITYHSELLGADRQAYVYTPYGYDTSKTYPVVYLIHGIGCDGGQWVSMGASKIFDNLIAKGEITPFVAVFPSVIPTEGIDPNTLSDTNIKAFTDFIAEFETDLSPYIKANYSVSDKREETAVCGLSMGGMEALRLGFSKLDTFGYIGSFSAAPTLEMELLTTEGSDYTPNLVLVCSGDKDSTVQTNPYNYHKKLEDNAVDHIWYQHPGGGHSPDVWNLGLLNFLKRTFQ